MLKSLPVDASSDSALLKHSLELLRLIDLQNPALNVKFNKRIALNELTRLNAIDDSESYVKICFSDEATFH